MAVNTDWANFAERDEGFWRELITLETGIFDIGDF